MVPKFIHAIVISQPFVKSLDAVDDVLRVVVKSFLHLHPSTTDGILYTHKVDGGLGMPRFRNLVRIAGWRANSRLLKKINPFVQHYLLVSNREAMFRAELQKANLPFPPSLSDINHHKLKSKNEELNRWDGQLTMGQGVNYFKRDRVGNSWLYEEGLLRDSRFIIALKLRTKHSRNQDCLRTGYAQNR